MPVPFTRLVSCLRTAAAVVAMLGCLAETQVVGLAAASELRMTPLVRAVQGARLSIVNIHGEKVVAGEANGAVPGDRPSRQRNGHRHRHRRTRLHHHESPRRRRRKEDSSSRPITSRRTSPHSFRTTRFARRPIWRSSKSIRRSRCRCEDRGRRATSFRAKRSSPSATRWLRTHRKRRYHQCPASQRAGERHAELRRPDSNQRRHSIPAIPAAPLLNIDGEMIGINVAVRAGAQGNRLRHSD